MQLFYRLDGLDLTPGNKSAGFAFHVDTLALHMLSQLTVGVEAQHRMVLMARERLANAGLLTKGQRASANIQFLADSACPRVFFIDPMFGSSLGADPEDFGRFARIDFLDAIGPTMAYTPHNIDNPKVALALALMVLTWGELAGLLLDSAPAPALPLYRFEPIPEYADLMTLKEFDECMDSHSIMNDDGSGYFATATHLSREADCFGTAPDWATHVAWFNK